MSDVSGRITRKKGQRITKLDFSTSKQKKLHPERSAEFLEEFRSLLRKYRIPLRRAK